MPKARNLIEAYNNFVVEPLKTVEKYLFLGFRGQL